MQMTTPRYVPVSGDEAREILNHLGYEIKSDDDPWKATMGMLVALAKEVDDLRNQLRSNDLINVR